MSKKLVLQRFMTVTPGHKTTDYKFSKIV